MIVCDDDDYDFDYDFDYDYELDSFPITHFPFLPSFFRLFLPLSPTNDSIPTSSYRSKMLVPENLDFYLSFFYEQDKHEVL